MLSGFYPARFWSTVRLQIHTLNYWTVWSVEPFFLTERVFECGIAHRRSVAVLCMLYKITCNPMHPRYGTLHAPSMMHPRVLYPSQYLCETILVTPYSMAWDWWVSRAGPTPFYWPSGSLPVCLVLLSIYFILFYGLVLWGWGLRTDRVFLALSQPCIANLFQGRVLHR